MNCTNPSTVATLHPKPRVLAVVKQVLLTAFLTFGLAVPFASANCLGKGLTQPPLVPTIPVIQAPAEEPDSARAETSSAATIVGLWNLKFYYQGQIVDVAFDAWHEDGTEVLNDYTDPINGNVCLGVWEKTGPSSYRLKHPSWLFDNNGVLLGTVVIYETITLSKDGTSFNGYYTDDVYDVNGALQEQYEGPLKATRIKPS